MKIATVIEDGRFGGPQRWISSVSGKLKGFSFNPIVIFPLDSDRFCEELILQGISTKQVSLHRLTKEIPHLIKFILLFIPETILLYRLFKNEDVDIVHCNNSWQFKGVIAGRLAGKKIVWHLHETATPFFVNTIFKFLASNFCDAFITAGKKVRTYYLGDQRFSKKQIIEIQAPVDTVVFDSQKVIEDPVIAAYVGFKIVTVGNVNPAKGLEYFIEMASILNQRYDNLNFVAVGPHFDSQRSYSDRIVELTKNHNLKNMHFYGSSKNIPGVLKAADVYVCSSITEASPISVWEAMSMGKAIVSTNVGDMAKFVKDGESGFVVPIKDAVALAEKVALLIENANLRKKVGANARRIAIKNLDVNICVKKQADFYRKIMNEL